MYGIGGFFGVNARLAAERMASLMAPDADVKAAGFYEEPGLALVQRRLPTADVSDDSGPISDETGGLVLVSCGEIYNSPELRENLKRRGHTFKTENGAEVILHLYQEKGDNAVSDLRGMFAFALWDRAARRLLLARDHMGQKSLFYSSGSDGSFAFASEVKCVLSAGLAEKKPDLEAVWHYMSLRYLPDDKTMFHGVVKLRAAHYAVFENGRVAVSRYWRLNTFKNKVSGSERELTDRLEEVLLESVRAHLLSDAPVGTFLSGGIDSSLVTSMMAKITGRPFPTFSVGVKEQDINELPWARMVSNKYGLQAKEEIVEADVIHRIPDMIYHMDEPSDPFGVGVYLVSQVAAGEVKVVLTGDGGDENFAGYDRFAGQRLAGIYSIVPAVLRKYVFGQILKAVPETFGYKSAASKLKWLNDMSFYAAGERYARSMSFLRFTDDVKASLFTDSAKKSIADTDSVGKILSYFEDGTAEEFLDKMLYTELMTRMPDHLLAIADRMSTAHSIEARPPLIDYKVTEFAASLPCNMKLRGRTLKYLLRKVSERYLDKALIDRPKQGFGFPIARWMRSDWAGLMRRMFEESRFAELGIFNKTEMMRLAEEHISGKIDHNFRLWILLNLEIWYRMNFENMTAGAAREYLDSRL